MLVTCQAQEATWRRAVARLTQSEFRREDVSLQELPDVAPCVLPTRHSPLSSDPPSGVALLLLPLRSLRSPPEHLTATPAREESAAAAAASEVFSRASRESAVVLAGGGRHAHRASPRMGRSASPMLVSSISHHDANSGHPRSSGSWLDVEQRRGPARGPRGSDDSCGDEQLHGAVVPGGGEAACDDEAAWRDAKARGCEDIRVCESSNEVKWFKGSETDQADEHEQRCHRSFHQALICAQEEEDEEVVVVPSVTAHAAHAEKGPSRGPLALGIHAVPPVGAAVK
ncbi:unnamed protein product [Lampetra fluviatilis]